MSTKVRPALRAGAFVDYPVANQFSIMPGAVFNMKGTKAEFNEANGTPVTGTTKLSYLTIPVLARMRLASVGSGVSPYLLAGPELGVLLSARSNAEVTATGLATSTEVDIKDSLKSTEWGVLVGAGLDVPMSNVTGLLEAGYDAGLTTSSRTGRRATTARPRPGRSTWRPGSGCREVSMI
jgi:hypothetical protein